MQLAEDASFMRSGRLQGVLPRTLLLRRSLACLAQKRRQGCMTLACTRSTATTMLSCRRPLVSQTFLNLLCGSEWCTHVCATSEADLKDAVVVLPGKYSDTKAEDFT